MHPALNDLTPHLENCDDNFQDDGGSLEKDIDDILHLYDANGAMTTYPTWQHFEGPEYPIGVEYCFDNPENIVAATQREVPSEACNNISSSASDEVGGLEIQKCWVVISKLPKIPNKKTKILKPINIPTFEEVEDDRRIKTSRSSYSDREMLAILRCLGSWHTEGSKLWFNQQTTGKIFITGLLMEQPELKHGGRTYSQLKSQIKRLCSKKKRVQELVEIYEPGKGLMWQKRFCQKPKAMKYSDTEITRPLLCAAPRKE